MYQPPAVIVDLGCSRGEAIARLVGRFPTARFIGAEVSWPMLNAARMRFVDQPNVSIQEVDLRVSRPVLSWPDESSAVLATVILSVLCIQFVPIEYRQAILQWVHDRLWPSGAFIFVEKVLGGSAQIDADMVELYYGMKRRRGYTEEQIDRKRLALEGVLVPQTAHANEEMLRSAGFRHIDQFWRWCNFSGWVALP